MEKILFYTNEWNDVEQFVMLLPDFDKMGIEVAFASDSKELIQLLSVGKLLVVTVDSYYPDISVYKTNKIKELKGCVLSFDELVETLN